jgi:hypothetical protein
MLLDYSVLYDRLTEAVGMDGLLMLPCEALKESPHVFLQLLLARLDTPAEQIDEISSATSGSSANVRSADRTWHLRRRRGRATRLSLPPWNLRPSKQTIELTPDITERIMETYLTGNHELAGKAEIELEKYGYLGCDKV